MEPKKFLITYKYNPTDLIFVCTKESRLGLDRHGHSITILKYVVQEELTPGNEGDTRYKGIEFLLDEINLTVEPYRKNASITAQVDVDQYLKRMGIEK